MNLRNLYRGVLFSTVFGAATSLATLPACRILGYGKPEEVEQQPSLLDRASAYRSALREQSELYRSGKLTAEKALENIEQLQSDFEDVEQETKKRLGEDEPENSPKNRSGNAPEEHTYKTLDDLMEEYAKREPFLDMTRAGFLGYVEGQFSGGLIDQDVYDSAQTWADSNFTTEDPVLLGMNGVMPPELPESELNRTLRRVGEAIDVNKYVLRLFDSTVGRWLESDLEGAYVSQPLGLRVAESLPTIYALERKAEKILINNNVLSSGKGLHGFEDFRARNRPAPQSPTAQPPAGLFTPAPKPPTEDDPEPSDDPFFGGGSAN